MSKCARCGIVSHPAANDPCGGGEFSPGRLTVACRDRELANLRSLLRSQTRKVEMALEAIQAPRFVEDVDLLHVSNLLLQVLEALS